jgi:hypothetical protein
MSAQTKGVPRPTHDFRLIELTLTSGTKSFRGARAVLNPATGKVLPAAEDQAGMIALGIFVRDVDATLADKPVTVDLEMEVRVAFFQNATSTDAVLATDVGKLAYHVDDQTVGVLSAGRTVAGRVLVLDSRGVGVAKLDFASVLGDAPLAPAPDVASFTANDWAPAAIVNGALYDVPTTGAASTVTLPAAAPDGTRASFAADGTKNAHTVQYRDATGPVNLTTALTAAKRHLVHVAKRDGKWVANAYVSP